MKNKLKIYFFWIVILLFSNSFSSADEFTFNASEIIVLNNENKIKAINGVEILTKDGVKITGDQFEYYKNENKLIIFGNVNLFDELNKVNVEGKEIIYFKKKEHLFIKGNSTAVIDDQYFVESKDLNLYRKEGLLSSENKTKIKDKLNNLLILDEFIYSNKKNTIRGKNINFLDKDSNKYFFEKFIINLENNSIAGKDLSISFNNSLFNNPENQPRLKGNSAISENSKTKISKGVFTTCKKRDGCPPWVITAKEVEHDKLKKTIYYKQAWLKVYDFPVLYFPKFFHPDPTVKRQSGFLIPTFSDSSNLGSSFKIPYFHVISVNKDLTFKPIFFAENKIILQSEYRQVNKDSKHIADFSWFRSNDESDTNSKSHLFLNSKFDLETSFFENSKLEFNLENSSNDTYLKTYQIKSPLIKNPTTLESYLNYEASNKDLYLKTYAKVYEDQSKNRSDRYEYIYPYFSISKNISSSFNKYGNLKYDFSGYQKKFNTNEYTLSAINDLHFKSNKSYTSFGLVENFDLLLKNTNISSKDAVKKTTDKQKFMTSLMYSTSLPLKKETNRHNNLFSPILSLRYSPNKTKNIRSDDRRMDSNNIFTLNRIGSGDTVEGGTSITLGANYSISRKNNDYALFSFGLAQNFRDNENEDLPLNSTIGKKSSDVFGNMNFKPNQYLDFDYNFAVDDALSKSKYDYLKGSLTINNFITSFEFLDDNAEDGQNYISSKTSYNFGGGNSLTFERRENKRLDLTEYYNLIYEYKNDCLIAGIEYNKQFYSDADLKPEEKLFFSITIVPFGTTTGPNINK